MTTIPDNFYRTSVKGLVLNQDLKFLLVKEKNGMRELPGGGLDFGETPHECLKREIKEEMGLDVLEIKPFPCYFTTTKHTKGHWIANILYEIRVNNLNFTPSDECVELGFFTVEEAKELDLFENVKAFVDSYRTYFHE